MRKRYARLYSATTCENAHRNDRGSAFPLPKRRADKTALSLFVCLFLCFFVCVFAGRASRRTSQLSGGGGGGGGVPVRVGVAKLFFVPRRTPVFVQILYTIGVTTTFSSSRPSSCIPRTTVFVRVFQTLDFATTCVSNISG